MKTKNNFRLLTAAIIISLTATSCQKEDNTPTASQDASMEKSAAPMRTTEVVHFEDFIQDYNFQPLVNDTSLVFEAVAHNPVTAPDGHQVTFAEINAVTGRASIKCVNAGTHVVLNMHGLIPSGVYSFFVTTFQSPGFTPTFEFMTADGVIGAIDGSQSTITADANGDGSISAIVRAGPLSEFGSIGPCLTGEFQVFFTAGYHIDGMSHGPVPGPPGTCVFPYGFVFQN